MSTSKETSMLPKQLYFAYGSNLWLKQMAARCPNSHYIGRAVLPDYRWQINERGYANVVPASGFTVHGLVYELGTGDEPRLDKSEGVSSGAYSKAYHSIILHSAPAALRKPTRSLVEDGGLARAIEKGREQMKSVREWDVRLWPGVLVYISHDFVHWGLPRNEYIDRMNYGIKDAISVGIPGDFFINSVRSLIPDRPATHHVDN
ncbi:hypothetical protein F4861DRAFT_9826 [Xylaria intraflava]|nr:hypothetical protein F4861DRAFT_9826 [Xylaria intraflava]